ncbi:MAG: proline--tRNA ligase [Elusimicrobia bacterium]|nr:proline--tRNA ligase [Elusimicrobiota bacterium]
MKMSSYFLPTLREAPQDADTLSAKLMLRAGLIRKLASGIYEWLPLGLRTLKKVENIIRQEMDRAGGQEVWLPVVQPKELWEETGRWNVYGKELLRLEDRKGAEFCFSPTAEEVITNMVRRDVRSWRQLPLFLYQFNIKFRDEIRPRFGVMRAREFYMKDGYSFHAAEEDANEWYQRIVGAYDRVFARCGFKYRSVEAETGAIGGNYSHEFMVLADTGENEIAFCACGYAANVEKAQVRRPVFPKADTASFKAPEEVPTPGLYTVEDVSKLLKIPQDRFIKTLFFMADGEPVLALVRGDHQLNENKLRRALGCAELEKASEEVYTSIAGCGVGFAGPVGIRDKFTGKPGMKPLKKILADYALEGVVNGVSGANKTDAHLLNINVGRDYSPDEFCDLKNAQPGDGCPKCGNGVIEFTRGIEVGHTFKLGTKYSKAMQAEFLDVEQKSRTMIMGCYGIGVSRIVAAAIEQGHDDNGIIWPAPLAPFEFSLITLDESPEVTAAAEKIYAQIEAAGMSALWDDRDERPGVKFKDADLIGLPYRIVIGNRSLKDGELEFKPRAGADKPQRRKLEAFGDLLKELKASV